MWQMVEGRIKPGDEDDIKMLVVKSDAFIRSRSRGSGIVNSFPFLRFVFPQTLGYNDQMAFFNSCNKVAGVSENFHGVYANLYKFWEN